MKRRRLAGMTGIGAVMAAAFVLFNPASSLRIAAYRHDAPGSATIVAAGTPSAAFALSGDAVPAELDAPSLNAAVLAGAWGQALPVNHNLIRLRGAFRLSFAEGQATATREQNHVVVFYPLGCTWLPAHVVAAVQDAGLCRSAGHIEIVRQSPSFLKARYDFDKPDGYSIAGRRSVRLPQAEEKKSVEIVDGEAIPLVVATQLAPEIVARIGEGRRELKQAARLISFMNEQPARVGPIKNTPDAAADAAARLDAIRGGESAVQCQGFRDIWLELAVRMPGVERVRSVAAYNYFPPFADLITFSHALAEIYVSDEGRWILIDPWFGFSLRHAGRFLGVGDLTALRRNENEVIEIVPLVTEIRRFVVSAEGTQPARASSVAATAPPMRSRFANGSYQLGYVDYFASVTYGPEYRRRAPVAAGSG
jgi:hypothetical protein